MHVQHHTSVVPAHIRHGELVRDEIRVFSRERTYVIASGLGPPRLWSYARRAVLDGFARGVVSHEYTAPVDRLTYGLHAARQRLAEASEELVEQTIPDAALTAVCIDEGKIFVVCAGASRVYVRRVGAPKRLTPRDELTHGLLHVDPIRSELPLQPGDLILAGTPTAFSDRAIARLSMVLDDAPDSAPAVIVSLLTEPPSRAGIAAAAFAARVR